MKFIKLFTTNENDVIIVRLRRLHTTVLKENI